MKKIRLKTDLSEIHSEKLDSSVKLFYQAISIYLTKTQVVNRKISFATNLKFIQVENITLQNFVTDFLDAITDDLSSQTIETYLADKGIKFVSGSIDDVKKCDDNNGIFLSIDLFTARNSLKFPPCACITIIGKN